jgi:hypothetical protein
LAVVVLFGWVINYVLSIPQVGPALLQAFIAGGVLLNVLKEEKSCLGKKKAGTGPLRVV